MINDESIRKLRELNLPEMVDILHQQQKDVAFEIMPFDERMQYVTDYVYQLKQEARIKRLIRMARFRYPSADIHSVHYEKRGIDRSRFLQIGTCAFVKRQHNVVFSGPTGAGKTWLACSIGKQACKNGYRVKYYRMPELLEEFLLQDSRVGGRRKLVKKLQRHELLIIDEWMSSPLDDVQISFVFELIESRYQNASTIFCTQFAPDEWLNRLGGGPQADAITDRIVHSTIFFDSGELNMRETTSTVCPLGSA